MQIEDAVGPSRWWVLNVAQAEIRKRKKKKKNPLNKCNSCRRISSWGIRKF